MPPPPPACLLLHLLRLLLLPPAGGGCRRIIRTFGGSPSWIGYAAAIATRVRQRARHVFAGERKAEETTKTRRDAETGQAVAHYSLLSMTTSDGAEPDMAAAIAARNACGAGQISSCGCSGDSGRGWSCLGHAGCVAALHSWRAAWGGCARRCRLGGWCVGGGRASRPAGSPSPAASTNLMCTRALRSSRLTRVALLGSFMTAAAANSREWS